MKTTINKLELIKPSYFKASPLLIAKMTCNKLKSYSMEKEAKMISDKITGHTTVEEAYQITSKYINWKRHYE
ncbi:hypothetical protein [Staphylococcus aureus]|uniref:hypothetical protein n=1 Tax=Staphylococcus aureus TaxID=1280 RepID=UPI003773E95F